MCTQSVNSERGLSTLIGPHPLCLESGSGDTEHVIGGTRAKFSRSTRVGVKREALGGGKRRRAVARQARTMIAKDWPSPNRTMPARLRHGDGRRRRTRSGVSGDNGEDDVVKVGIVVESADPRRIG